MDSSCSTDYSVNYFQNNQFIYTFICLTIADISLNLLSWKTEIHFHSYQEDWQKGQAVLSKLK